MILLRCLFIDGNIYQQSSSLTQLSKHDEGLVAKLICVFTHAKKNPPKNRIDFEEVFIVIRKRIS